MQKELKQKKKINKKCRHKKSESRIELCVKEWEDTHSPLKVKVRNP